MSDDFQTIKAAIASRIDALRVEPAEGDKLLDAAGAVYWAQRACTLDEMLEYINEWNPASCRD